jgi:WD40 repeat protein
MSIEPAPLVVQAAYSQDGALIAHPGRSRSAEVRDASTLEVKARMVGHAEMVLCCAFSPDSKMLATSDIDGTVMLWEVDTGRPLATVLQVNDQLSTLVFTNDGGSLITAGQSGLIRRIDLTHYDEHIAGNAQYMASWFQRVEGKPFGNSPIPARDPHPQSSTP